jgi:hypothetical protein
MSSFVTKITCGKPIFVPVFGQTSQITTSGERYHSFIETHHRLFFCFFTDEQKKSEDEILFFSSETAIKEFKKNDSLFW